MLGVMNNASEARRGVLATIALRSPISSLPNPLSPPPPPLLITLLQLFITGIKQLQPPSNRKKNE